MSGSQPPADTAAHPTALACDQPAAPPSHPSVAPTFRHSIHEARPDRAPHGSSPGPRTIASFLLPLLLSLLLPACNRPTTPKPRDILFISIDTLRWDRLGCTGHDSAETPNIDRLAASGVLYPNAVAAAPLTLPSHATIFTGRLPIEHGVRDNAPFRLPEGEETLTRVLAERGYQTFAVIGAQPLAPGCGLESGFEVYDYEPGTARTGSVLLAERRADEVTDAALRLARQRDAERPLFLFVHYFDPHARYDPPEPFRSRFAEAPYDGEIAFVDQQVGRLLNGLDRGGTDRPMLIVLTSDHGESLGEHGEEAHGFFLYEATIRVPLIVVDPARGQPMGATTTDQVRLQDLRGFLEARAAGESFDLTGPARRGEPALIESLYAAIHCDHAQLRGLRLTADAKYLEAGDEEFYDLGDDPGELNDLAGGGDPRVGPAGEQLARLLKSMRIDRSSAASSGQTGLPGYLQTPMRPELVSTRTRQENLAYRSPAAMTASIRALQEGVRLREAGLFDAAARVLARAIEADPGNPALHFRLGLALRSAATLNQDRNQLLEAIEAFRMTLKTRPGQLQARDLLIHSLTQVGNYQEAHGLARSGLDDGSATAKTLEALGKLHHTRRGRFANSDNPFHDLEEGTRCLKQALEMDPSASAIREYLDGRYQAIEDG